MRSSLPILLLIILIIPSTILGQNDWNQMDGPFGGTITVMAFNSQNHIYGGSFSGMYKSTDEGDSWTQLSPSFFSAFQRITSVFVDANDNVLVAGYGGGMGYSTDDGNTWVSINGNLNDTFIEAVMKTSTGSILASTFNGVFKSTDMGQTWNNLPNYPVGASATTFFVDENNAIYAGTYGGAYRSTDEGDNWENLNDGLTNPSVSSFGSYSTGKSTQTIFAATRGEGVFRWDNALNKWVQLVVLGLASLNINSIAVNSAGDIFATTEIGLFFLALNSNSWTAMAMGSLLYTYFAFVAVSKVGHIYACKDWDGVHRSKDNGANWAAINFLLTAYTVFALSVSQAYGALMMGSDYAFFTFLFASGIWQVINPPYPFFWPTAIAATAAYIYVGTFFDGLYRYTRATQEWLKLENGLAIFGVTALLIDALGKLYVGTNNGVFVSENNGDSFSQLGGAALALYVTAMIINNIGTLFIGTSNQGVYYWDLSSTSWIQVITGLTALSITALAIDAFGYIYAATRDGGIFKSENQGLVWLAVNVGFASLFINDIVHRATHRKSQAGSLITSTADGVYVSTDQGANWVKINSGLNGNMVSKLAVDSSGTVYAGTIGGGIYTHGNTTSVKQVEETNPENYFLLQNYPNPFNPTTNIKFSLKESGKVTLSIFNSLGQKVKDLVNRFMSAGTYEFAFDAGGLSSGNYFYRLITCEFSETKKMVLIR